MLLSHAATKRWKTLMLLSCAAAKHAHTSRLLSSASGMLQAQASFQTSHRPQQAMQLHTHTLSAPIAAAPLPLFLSSSSLWEHTAAQSCSTAHTAQGTIYMSPDRGWVLQSQILSWSTSSGSSFSQIICCRTASAFISYWLCLRVHHEM